MKKSFLVILLAAVGAFAAEGAASGGTDIIPRTINFLIFAAILWYLVGDKARKFFSDRKENIAKKFQEIEEKLKESKDRKEALKAELQNSKKFAEEIIENAKEEAVYLENKIKAQTEEEIKMLQKHFEEYKNTAIRKIKQEAVEKYLEELFKDIHLSSEDAAKLILKAA